MWKCWLRPRGSRCSRFPDCRCNACRTGWSYVDHPVPRSRLGRAGGRSMTCDDGACTQAPATIPVGNGPSGHRLFTSRHGGGQRRCLGAAESGTAPGVARYRTIPTWTRSQHRTCLDSCLTMRGSSVTSKTSRWPSEWLTWSRFVDGIRPGFESLSSGRPPVAALNPGPSSCWSTSWMVGMRPVSESLDGRPRRREHPESHPMTSQRAAATATEPSLQHL